MASMSKGFIRGHSPFHADRHTPLRWHTGWFLSSERDSDEQFNDVDYWGNCHVSHIRETCTRLVRYLALPPGWRIAIDRGREDIWFDPLILKEDAE